MGIFYEQVEMINRTSGPLPVRFDGQDLVLKANYTSEGKFIGTVHNMVPTVVVPYARAQCVLMGSEDPLDPSLWESLVGVKGNKKHDTSYKEQSDVLSRVDLEQYLDDPNAKIVVAGRRVRLTEARPVRDDQMPFEPRMS